MAIPTSAAPPAPVKIMLFGDSLTHGFNADWTWRYRLWQSLKASNTSFDFVGPRNDVMEYTTLKVGSQGYRQPNFDRDHASVGGLQFLSGNQLSSLSRTYRPDVVVGLIGLNDLMAGASMTDLERHWRQEIAAARRYDRGVDVVLVQLPHTWNPNVGPYNDTLVRVAADLDTPQERVVVTDRATFDVWSDVFDYLHFSAPGELKVAAVVAQTLTKVGVGNGRLATTPDPPDDHTWAPVPRASFQDGIVTATWPSVTYASAEHVFIRDDVTGEVGVQQYVQATSATFPGTAGHTYSVWLGPVKGYLWIGTASQPISIDVPAVP
ncbi:MAG: SGNH/GDSL hydrolase family protein [Aeromicrobium sp.]